MGDITAADSRQCENIRCFSPVLEKCSLEPLTLRHHTRDLTHSTQVHVTDSWCVQVTKTGHILTKSPFHWVLNWVRLGHGQGCPLAVDLKTRALGMLSWLQGLRGLSLGVTHREPLDKGKRYAQQNARPCRAVGPTRAPQTDHPPPQGWGFHLMPSGTPLTPLPAPPNVAGLNFKGLFPSQWFYGFILAAPSLLPRA